MRNVIIIGLIGIVFLLGCTGGGLSLGTKDCGTNEECFIDALTNCSPAKYSFDSETQTIIEKSGEYCKVKSDVNVQTTDGEKYHCVFIMYYDGLDVKDASLQSGDDFCKVFQRCQVLDEIIKKL